MNRPARFPPHGAWPAVMRADMTAAYFDLDSVAALHQAINRGEVPRPTDTRFRGRAREPLWALEACRNFITHRHEITPGADHDNILELI